jgi:uncharacterized protein (DUF488 family)
MPVLFTIGHSNHSISQFVRLLSQHAIEVVCDVRSVPYSKANPQFHREELGPSLRKHGIQYLFLGAALGARTRDPDCIVDGRVSYCKLAKSEHFTRGIAQVQALAASRRAALMCAEKDHLECHRTILLSRCLIANGCSVQHILDTGDIESHEDALARLIARLNFTPSLFRSRKDLLMTAYERQEERIAWKPGILNCDLATSGALEFSMELLQKVGNQGVTQ